MVKIWIFILNFVYEMYMYEKSSGLSGSKRWQILKFPALQEFELCKKLEKLLAINWKSLRRVYEREIYKKRGVISGNVLRDRRNVQIHI